MMRPLICRLFTLLVVLGGGFRCLGVAEVAISNSSPVAFTVSPTDAAPAPPLGALPTPGTVQDRLTDTDGVKKFQLQLDLGREQRRQKSADLAQQTLSELLTQDAPPEIKRLALFELALVAQDAGQVGARAADFRPIHPDLPG